MVLSIPFAVSQTRKAIPAGRYEALSGIKISHSQKSSENSLSKDTLSLIGAEIAKNLPTGQVEKTYFSSGSFESSFLSLLTSKGVQETKTNEGHVTIVLSDDLIRDTSLIKSIQKKGSLLMLKEKHPLKFILTSLDQFEVILYQSEAEIHYYLLKRK